LGINVLRALFLQVLKNQLPILASLDKCERKTLQLSPRILSQKHEMLALQTELKHCKTIMSAPINDDKTLIAHKQTPSFLLYSCAFTAAVQPHVT